MTGPEADALGARLALHLRHNQFEVCRNVLDEIEQSARARYRESVCNMPLAETSLDLRLVNILERAGYLYVRDLDGADLSQVRQLGTASCKTICNVVGDLYREECRLTRLRSRKAAFVGSKIPGYDPVMCNPGLQDESS